MKKRADQLLVDKGLAESVKEAQALIMAGAVLSGTRRIDKAGEMLKPDAQLSVKTKEHPYVSRGALKLVKGLDEAGFDPAGCVCMDVGCSTGGFTEVLLLRGAKKVYAVDVGYGQLAEKLRTDSRVVVLERTNARNLTENEIPEPVDFIVCDASFIHLQTVLEKPLTFAKETAFLVALIKPQFEAPKHLVGEGGIVRDEALRARICEDMKLWINGQKGWRAAGVFESPIKGAQGNVEYLLTARKTPQ